MLAVLTGALFAQQSLISSGVDDAGGFWQLKYLFTADADWFMDLNDYGQVQMESFFTMAKASGFSQHQAAGGFSKDLGFFYLGTYFDINFGNNTDPGFVEENELQLMIGTSQIGAFKILLVKDDLSGAGRYKDFMFGLAWGMNFPMETMTIKPEVGIGFISFDEKTGGIKGAFNTGISVDLDFYTGKNYNSSIQSKYELSIGTGSDSNVSLSGHNLAFLYQRLYPVADKLTLGWGLGAKMDISFYKAGSAKSNEIVFNADSVLGLNYSFNEIFSLAGQVFAWYPISYNENSSTDTTAAGGPKIRTVLGGVFRPHPNFAIEMRCSPGAGLNGTLTPVQFELMATLKK